MLAITIGNFDGVHLGHQALVGRCRAVAGPQGRCVAVTLDPHPVAVLRPLEAPRRLQTLSDRIAALKAAGADEVTVLDTTRGFLAKSPEEFIRSLRGTLPFDVIVEGSEFRFGRGRAGSVESLRALGRVDGFRVEEVPAVEAALSDGSVVPVSSTLVRWLLAQGRVACAARALGRPFALAGRVVRGDQRGRTLGFPTANLDHGDIALPADGIYAGQALLPDGSLRAAAISVGNKPSFGGSERLCEAHILGFQGLAQEYGWTLRLHFLEWLRPQFSYSQLEPLIAQISADVQAVRTLIPETVAA
ncbi:MAG: bifunctional riboflavin kinase/FMN adenylyltransferase [Phycisphaerales bacterium]